MSRPAGDSHLALPRLSSLKEGGLLTAAYGVEISNAGRQRLAIEKQSPSAIQDSLMGATAESIEIQYDKIYEPTPNEGPIFFLTDDNWAEVDSLACNMETIERYISGFLDDPKNTWDSWNVGNLGKALNAYSHKQHDAILSGKDTYLQSIQDRFDMIDSGHQSAMVNKLRSLVGSVQRCIDIDWKSEYFRQDIDQTIPDLPELQDATSSLAPSAYFSQSMAVYSYMKEMNRQSQDLSLVQKMLGTQDEAETKTALGNIQKKTSLEDGLAAYHRDHGIVHLIEADRPADYQGPLNYGIRKDGTIVERPNEELHNSAIGYDWSAIMKQYLEAHPELEGIVR
ncbi:hypothetical protein [uncultured Selenomonas sp.]|uniref:hypothetical protein n=1 Tax=uncultured Selenomonas sp. TaxID=159275 RepID=UPI0025E76EE9|nr:hypothetical protein [uncultured Selenomonas sp.]